MKFNYRSSILCANASGFYSRSSLMRWQFSLAAIFASIFSVTASTGSFGQDNTEQRILELNEQAALYQEQLSKLNNSYDETTSEVFLALAGIQHELGNFEHPNRSYLEAIQVLRVSQGLNSEAQLSVMEAFNDSLYAQ